MTANRPTLARRSIGLLLILAVGAIALAYDHQGRTVLRLDELGRLARFHRTYQDLLQDRPGLVRRIEIHYITHGGRRRRAFVVLPKWYDAAHNPALPLVISPHGRGVPARNNLNFWGSLPAFGPFILVSPQGQGRREQLYSWAWRDQISDLARMPAIIQHALPWLRLDHRRTYAVGSSMGGQETLMLIARHPRLLIAAAALDSATDMAARYRAFPGLRGGRQLQSRARREIGGTPSSAPSAYAERSPSHHAAAIGQAPTHLLIWWSTRDRIIKNQRSESGALYAAILRAAPRAHIIQHVGTWAHSHEFYATAQLPIVLVRLGLIELDEPPPRSAL